ncbi:cobalamin-dependent protein [Anaerobacillus sp. MEB173]|uniref:cobalamin B12-binding domain-containing protein n=1 Tax=Anaerobacillus sp. MEB173 TaxID=3383345 RepID=UPI003F8E6B27
MNTVENTQLLDFVLKELNDQLTVHLSQINYCEDLETTSYTLIDYIQRGKKIVQSYMKKDTSITLLAEDTKQEIEKQIDLIFRNIENLLRVKDLSEHATTRMTEIKQSNEEIVGGFQKALDILTNIARHTRVLSINSNIEASRIGDKGLTFKVISKEVQKLSDTTADAAAEMSGSTKQITQQSNEMSQLLSQTHETLNESVNDLNNGKSGFDMMKAEIETIVTESIVLDELLQTTYDLLSKALSMLEYNKVSISNIKKTLAKQATQTEALIQTISQSLNLKQDSIDARDFRDLQFEYYKNFRNEKRATCINIIHQAHELGFSPELILTQIVEFAVEKIGKEQIERDVPLSEIYLNGRIIEESLDLLLPLLTSNNVTKTETIVIGNAFGDYHALGRKIVVTFLKLGGFDVIDLGLSVSNEQFVDTVKKSGARLVCVSALIIHTAKEVKELRQLLNKKGLSHVKILVGGAPFNFEPRLADEVGADQMAHNAIEATRVAKEMLGLLKREG